jgi:rhodanese-related sulfurtransferase
MADRLIDVREYPEFAEGHIDGAELVPLGTLDKASEFWERSEPLRWSAVPGEGQKRPGRL